MNFDTAKISAAKTYLAQIKMFDANGDGTIDRKESIKAPEEIRNLFKGGDKSLSFEKLLENRFGGIPDDFTKQLDGTRQTTINTENSKAPNQNPISQNCQNQPQENSERRLSILA